jgi:meckelin
MKLCLSLKRFNNWTACQLQANLCTLSLHNTDHPTCKYFSSYKAPGSDPHPNGLPHLYFGKDGRNLIGRDEEITNVYKTAAGSPSNRLNFTVAKYSLRGKLLGLDTDASGALFQMCPGSFSELDAAFNFGTRYTRSCKIPVHRLFARGEPVFYDLYVPYMSKNAKETHLFAVPMLMRNLIESNKVGTIILHLKGTYIYINFTVSMTTQMNGS